jgi:hypothetical protein
MRTNTHIRRWLTGLRIAGPVLLAFLFAVTVLARAAEPAQQGGSKLKVLTYNVYSGTAYAGATDPSLAKFRQAMTNAVLDVRASDPAGRVQAVARQIANHSPHLVSLQEVFTLSTGPSKDALTLEFDYLELLMQALAAQGASYTPVESVTTWDATVPSTSGYLRSTWRIVILARTDLAQEQFFLTNVDGKPFTATITYPLPALNGSADCPVPLTGTGACMMPWTRGWALADVTYRGKQFRYVNATLESNSTSKNIAQGLELLNGPLNTTRPVILAGDLNCDLSNFSDPKRLTCVRFIDAGFQDAWGAAKASQPGFTKELPNMTMRSDYVMIRGLFHAEAASLIGEDPADWTASGLWPSNHAGVVVKLDRPELE